MATQRIGSAAFAALLFLTLSCDENAPDLPLEPVYEEPQDASISGEVIVEEAGVAGVEISLTGPESGSFTTDADGRFSFTELRRGTYTLVLWGFDPAVHTFPITEQTVTAADTTEVKVEFTGTLVPYPPAPATELRAEAVGPESVDLSWKDQSDDETEFRVERREGADGEWAQIAVTGADTASFSDIGLQPNTTYGYRVQACNEVGCSLPTEEASATTEEVPPVAPDGLSAEAEGSSVIHLNWTDRSNNETGFQVERKTAADTVWTAVGAPGTDTVSFSDRELSPATTYAYRVRACNEIGCSEYTEEAGATTEDVPPQAPSGLVAEASGFSSIDLEWADESDNETEFRIERREGVSGAWSQVETIGADETATRDRGLSPLTSYTYRVQACNSVGCSGYSDEASATTPEVSGPNLRISDLYITQSTQTLDGDVPLVADKRGYLRVFVLADESNDLEPDVEIRFYHGGSLVHSETISAPGPSVPTSVSEASLAYSWNVALPKTLIQPGLSILAEVDPGDEIPEPDEGDNAFPSSGSPGAMDVRATSTFDVTFVPVRQNVNGLVGNVISGNADDFLDDVMELLPLADFDADVHAVYATDALEVENDNDNGAWGTILSEINALRVAEGGSRYYYGVVKTNYTSGVAGMGYLGWPAAVGWDRLPSGSGVAAHEWGHNWDLRHAPGCGVANPDPSYPYADGKIGVWGMNVESEALKSPSTYYDFMSYCGPEWISDYMYESVLDYRQAHGAWAVSPAAEPSLLIWGRVEGGRIVLEPAFEVNTSPALPSGRGDYRLEGLRADGTPLFSAVFQPVPVPDGQPGEGHFAFALPLNAFDPASLARVRVRGGAGSTGTTEPRRGPELTAPPQPVLTGVGGSVVEMTWDAGAYPMALVRDPGTGEVLSFARGGSVRIPISADEVEVVFSDGLRSSEPVRRAVR